MLENVMSDCLYRIGDFAGFVEYVKRPPNAAPTWHLVMTSDNLGAHDVRLLQRVGIEFYRPLMRSMQLVPRKRLSHAQRRQPVRPLREKVEPLFPGYAFINMPDGSDERWREVFRMTYIRGLVCAQNQPVKMRPDLIEEIVAREVDGAVPSETKVAELMFKVGDTVRITDGPFRSFHAMVDRLPTLKGVDLDRITLEELDDSHRVKLLVDIFGRPNPIELHVSEIEAIY